MADIALPIDVAETGERTTGALPRARRNWDWLGLVPFFAFLFLFLIVPAFSVFRNALRTEDGYSLSAMKEAMSGQNQEAFWFTIKFSALSALVGVVLGALLAYAAATATRPAMAAQSGLVVQRRRRQHGRHPAGVRLLHIARSAGSR